MVQTKYDIKTEGEGNDLVKISCFCSESCSVCFLLSLLHLLLLAVELVFLSDLSMLCS